MWLIIKLYLGIWCTYYAANKLPCLEFGTLENDSCNSGEGFGVVVDKSANDGISKGLLVVPWGWIWAISKSSPSEAATTVFGGRSPPTPPPPFCEPELIVCSWTRLVLRK